MMKTIILFMDINTYDQIELSSDIISEDQSKFLIENSEVVLLIS